ncbi:Zinc finger protein 518A [Dissostichus eleginoides]|uniref:Zinc finger protein 518A n=1 Tax=Dissostichus eleginoides TaxID=100907 RepID=A0AAD9FNH8_DISEL|nr:Zinc finger protein 518A [Dissostichus eleginoides]
MDSGDIHAATSRGDNKRRGNKKNRDWHKRPHLRNTVVQPPTMQSEDKRGPKKIAEGWEQSTVWPSSKKPPQEAQQGQHRINDNGNTLRFTCSQCKDNSEYVPKDLVKHFKSTCMHIILDWRKTETKLNDMLPAQSEPSACGQMQENRENREIKTDQEMEDNSKKPEEPMHEDRNNISSELKSTNEGEEQTSIHKVLPNNKKQRRKRRARSKKVAKRSSGSALKIVLKKNPVKEKQWVTQSSLSPSGCGQMDGPPNTHVKLEGILQNTLLTEEHQQKLTKASESDPDDLSKAVTQNPQPKQGEELTPSCAAKTTRSKNTDGDTPVKLKGLPLMHQEMGHESDKPPEAEVDEGGAACETGLIAGTEVSPGNAQLNTSGSNTDCHVSAADGETPHSSSTQPSPVSQPVITAQGKVTHTDVSHAQHSVEGWLPKNQERTLKLVAMNPSQLVKRPAGDQPVVVLNHPDADIPEVTRIMEVLNRYRGEVQKVVLSRKTVSALAAANCEANAEPDPAWNAKNSVQERFVLKLKLRRLSRKKYEVVAAAAPSGNVRKEFRCWFCGRIFACQETWMVHRQRHLMDWKGPKLENS